MDQDYFDLFWHKEEDTGRFDNVWRHALGETLLTKDSVVKLSDFSLNHVPETKLFIYVFKAFGLCLWMITPMACMMVLLSLCELVLPRILHESTLLQVSVHLAENVILAPLLSCWECIRSYPICYALLLAWSTLETLFWGYMHLMHHAYGQPDTRNFLWSREEREKVDYTFKILLLSSFLFCSLGQLCYISLHIRLLAFPLIFRISNACWKLK